MKIRIPPVRGKRRLASMETSVKLQAEKAFKNAVTFAPRSGAKVLASLPGSLARQCFRGIRFHARRAAAPSRSPAPAQSDSVQSKFFDTLSGPRRARPCRCPAGEDGSAAAAAVVAAAVVAAAAIAAAGAAAPAAAAAAAQKDDNQDDPQAAAAAHTVVTTAHVDIHLTLF